MRAVQKSSFPCFAAGVNTHKGAIFTLGLLSASAGRLRRSTAQLNAAEILSEAQKIAAPSMKAEFTRMRQLSKDSPELSHGERLFLLHGECGIRGEAAEGFPILTRHAIPALRTALNAGLSPDAAQRHQHSEQRKSQGSSLAAGGEPAHTLPRRSLLRGRHESSEAAEPGLHQKKAQSRRRSRYPRSSALSLCP